MFSAAPTQADVENFVGHLVGRGWVKFRQLREELSINDRHCRALAQASRGRVISGNRGYKLTTEADKAELSEAMQRQRSQADKTLTRCDLTESVWAAAQATGPF